MASLLLYTPAVVAPVRRRSAENGCDLEKPKGPTITASNYPMPELTVNRVFILLRLTLIIATAYLLLVEHSFALPPAMTLILLSVALLSNLAVSRLPRHVTATPVFGIGLVLFDTAWITATLVQSGHFNAEFFFLYFFVILLSAIGENLGLIALGAVVVCVGYVYLMISTGETPSMWNSPSLIRIPFLFTTTAFYGYLIERTRAERQRAEIRETERDRAESALSETMQQLADEAEVSSALARVGRELISSLDKPVILERLCQLTAEGLRCDNSATLMRQPEEKFFQAVASYGLPAEAREAARVLRVPRDRLNQIFSSQGAVEVAEVDPHDRILPTEFDSQIPSELQVLLPLWSGNEVIGVQVANWNQSRASLATKERRVAAGIAQLASMALANSRLVEELEHANELKSDFVASMSHELRTPLNLIIGYNELMLDGTFGPVRFDQQDTLQRIGKSARELLDLIEATLDLSRLESKEVPLDISKISVQELVEEIRGEILGGRQKDNVELRCEVPDEPLQMYSDPIKLRMILKNLVGNAMKFTSQGSVTLTVRANDSQVELIVTDTGIGMSKESLAVIFEPFRQGDRSISARFGGVGLGLYIVSRLVDNLEGTVKVESEPGVGSTFHVVLARDLRGKLRAERIRAGANGHAAPQPGDESPPLDDFDAPLDDALQLGHSQS